MGSCSNKHSNNNMHSSRIQQQNVIQKYMTDLQNKLIKLSNNKQSFKCTPFEDSWSIIVTDKTTGNITESLAFDKDQSLINN